MLAVTKPVAAALNQRCDAWLLRLDKLSFEQEGDASAKTVTLKQVWGCYHKTSVACLAPPCHSRRRLFDALALQHGSRLGSLELVGESRLLLHLGRANVLENVGLYADRTTGLPLVPGTALKGLLSTWACWADHFNAADGSFRPFTPTSTRRGQFTTNEAKLARQILGDDSPTGSEHAGAVIFVGGFPRTPPRLGLDIVNPHHEADGTVKTRLTPSAFLCVEPGTFWRFVFYVRPGTSNAADLIATTQRWMKESLTQAGIGAKTAAGYGRFRPPNAADLAAQHQLEAQSAAAAAAAAQEAQGAAQAAMQQAAAQAALKSDYPNEATFKNRVLAKLNPGQLEQLQPEIPLLQKPDNVAQLGQLKKLLASKEYKDIRKRLRDKDWFPQGWLPSQ